MGFIDLSKAFDNVNVVKLWELMHVKDKNIWIRKPLIAK
jgi:hypothetical protein